MQHPWLDRSKSAEERAELLLGRMTLDDKLALMNGGSPDPGLGIPPIVFSDGPAGVTSGEGNESRAGTQLPAPIALAASFDEERAREYGELLGKEAAERGVTVLLAPTVNIARSGRNGRTFEGYGEDPHLSGMMGAETVQGIQSQGVIANVKHYAANNQETDRFAQNSIIDERVVRELYLPAFEAAVTEGGAASAMASYNKINGIYGTEHRALLTDILKRNWGFRGFVVSDFMATQHAVKAANAGLDFELTVPFKRLFGEPLKSAVENGQVSMAVIDEAAGRILKTLFRFGHFDKGSAAEGRHFDDYGEGGNASPLSRTPAAALRLAQAGIVLLQNEGEALPLAADACIAVIGQAAGERMVASGGGSAHVVSRSVVSPLTGIRSLAQAEVHYARGTAPVPSGPKFMYGTPNEDLAVPEEAFEDGLQGYYYETGDLSGEPVRTDRLTHLNIVWGFEGAPPVSARWTGRLRAPSSGMYTFYLPSAGGSRLFVNGRLVLDNWDGGSPYASGTAELEEGVAVDIEVQFTAAGAPAALPCLALHWYAGSDDELIREAADLAAKMDAAVVFANDYMTENYDKPGLSLPGAQDRLIEEVAKANPNTVVVLNVGGPVLMPWHHCVKAVLMAWYPGQEGGHAIASALYGLYNPSGKLPVTIPASERQVPTAGEGQFPGIELDTVYTEGLEVGYRWYDAHGETPLFPFGHGLSFTAFKYASLTVKRRGATVEAEVDVRNAGGAEGRTAVQLYVSFPDAAGEPPKQLKRFRSVRLAPGESVTVRFTLRSRDLSIWDTANNRWTVPAGSFTLLVGESSRDIRLVHTFIWEDEPHADR